MDHIVHHAYILKFEGDSYRIKDFLTRFQYLAITLIPVTHF